MAVLAAGTGGVWYARHRFEQAGPLAAATDVIVPRGSPAQVGEALLRAGVIGDVAAFRVAVEATRAEGPLHAAELSFPAHATLHDVLAVLRDGRPVQHRVTIPEGLTAARIAELLARAEPLAGDAIVPAEGEILPETYSVERGATRASVLARGRAAMARALAQAWEGREAGLPLAEPHELLVLASIVERETARPEERPRIAAVFLNRLRRGMRLQSDPTVIYVVSGGLGELPRRLTRQDLEWPGPGNTYVMDGLPREPIASPGVASLAAVAHPLASEELYFVADGSGGHAFAETLTEHERNVARWRALEAQAP